MVILDNEKREMLIKKLIFTLDFIITTNKNFEDIFDVRVLDTEDNKVKMFELKFKNEESIFLYFKKLCNDDIEIRYIISSNPDNFVRDETTLRFTTGLSESGMKYCEFLGTAETIFDIVTEIEKEKQYQKLNETLNNILKY